MSNLAIFDFNRTIYDPETKQMIPHAKEVLQELRQRGWRLYLVSHAEGPHSLIYTLKLDQLFHRVTKVLEDKSATFQKILACESGVNTESVYVIGDRVRVEIAQGNKLGFHTVWFRSGRFAQEIPRNKNETPTYTITSLRDLLSFMP